jgi:hypothetical protein
MGVLLWDARSLKEVMTPEHTGRVFRVGFTPDDRYVYSVAEDWTRLWPVNPLPIAEGARPRDFTAKEREMFLIGDGPSP